MLILGKKRGILEFDPESIDQLNKLEQHNPGLFAKPPCPDNAKFSPEQVAEFLPTLFHCHATKYAVDITPPKLASVKPARAVYRTLKQAQLNLAHFLSLDDEDDDFIPPLRSPAARQPASGAAGGEQQEGPASAAGKRTPAPTRGCPC